MVDDRGSRGVATDGATAAAAGDASTCLVCGYAIRGMAADASCPECGTLVARSLRGATLEFADPAYVRSLRTGLRLVLVGFVAAVLGFGITTLLMAAFVGQGRMAVQTAMILSWAMGFLAAFLSLGGWWLLTGPDPAIGDRTERDGRLRKLQRTLVVVIAIGTIIGFVVLFTPLSRTPLQAFAGNIQVTQNTRWDLAFTGAIAARIVLWAAKLLSFFVGLLVLGSIAARIPDPGLARTFRRMLWLIPLLATVGIVACGLGPIAAIVLYAVGLWMLAGRLTRILRVEEQDALSRARPASQ
jgi:predicted RNA-binding Zn-ribbon protein involved in translation (DUF1610 family)